MSTVTRDELMQVFQQLQGQFSSKKQDLAHAQRRFDALRTGFVEQMHHNTERMAGRTSVLRFDTGYGIPIILAHG